MKRILAFLILLLPWLAMSALFVWLIGRMTPEALFVLARTAPGPVEEVLSLWSASGLGLAGLRYMWEAIFGPVVIPVLMVQAAATGCVLMLHVRQKKKDQKLTEEIASEHFSKTSEIAALVHDKLSQKERRIAMIWQERIEDRHEFENTLHELRSKLMTLYFVETDRQRDEVIQNADRLIRQTLSQAAYTACSLKALVQKAVRSQAGLIKKANVHVQCHLTDIQLVCDGLWLQQVLETVLANALESTPENGTIHVRTDFDQAGNASIMITNPQKEGESRDKGRYKSDRPGHYGIGLSMAQEVLARHHGRLDTKSAGHHFQLTIILPISQLEEGRPV